ncbi:MAG: alanine--tRNA ligase, partial [Lachnospiraceae bacterium]|nr:alanine--tRNA ligase [Lachnospiraceae bacterium]
MKQFTSDELRKTWKQFYIDRGHKDVGAVSLISDGSTGVLFNVAGMQPLMPYLLGQKHPLGTRLCNVQGCVRTNDIESVGDKSHVTFFEMMGSWSLGDYFKEERCKWSYELLTEVFGFDRDHLAATVFEGDENAPRDEEGAQFRIASGFKKENIFYLPAEDNWWGLEYGPCGPDSEMFYVNDREPCGPDCGPGCSCGKYTELGNDVFMQYEKHKDGSLTPLKQKNVDTGWGLERILAFLNGTMDVYRTDLFVPVIAYIEKASGHKYDEDAVFTRSMRILSDHIRTSVMLIGDERRLTPSNVGAGYVLRRLIRRAVRHARVLGMKKDEILEIAGIFTDQVYKESFPGLTENREFIMNELNREINRFELALENGIKEFKKILEEKKAAGSKIFSGRSAFYLYDTFGFPLELTMELASEADLSVDEKEFEEAMEEQKQTARDSQSFAARLDSDDSAFDDLGEDRATEFKGYEALDVDSDIIAMSSDGKERVTTLSEGDEGIIITPVTTFYATMGGQKGDTGVIRTDKGVFEVSDTCKMSGGMTGHMGKVKEGKLSQGDRAHLSVDPAGRRRTCRNHSATHLLQSALRSVLGDHVEQQGSYQDTLRTRFDFSHPEAMTRDELRKVESIVNENIARDIAVSTEVMGVEEAKKSGAMALFGEKYGDEVRVVSMGDVSKELCGGTHVSHTGDIGGFKILSESSVASGVRRIEAVTGDNLINYYETEEKELLEAAEKLKIRPADLSSKIESMLSEIKELKAENDELRKKEVRSAAGDALSNAKDINGIKFL